MVQSMHHDDNQMADIPSKYFLGPEAILIQPFCIQDYNGYQTFFREYLINHERSGHRHAISTLIR